MSRDLFTPVARTVPFDILNTSIRADNLQETIEELRRQTVFEPEYWTSTLNGEAILSSASSTLHIANGTATGYHFHLPDATTLFNGQNYLIANKSSASMTIVDFNDNFLFELLADSIATIYLRDNSTQNGLWVGYVVSGFATGILSYNLISDTPFTTNSTTFVVITGYSVTPVAGTYSIWYNASILYTTTPISHYWALFRGGVIIDDSEREQLTSRSNQNMVDTTQTVAQFDGSQTLDVRVRRGTSGQITVNRRSLTLIRLGP
jgi:hypothetical protein